MIWVCLKMSCTPKPNGVADHYPYEKWLFHWEYTLFSDKPILDLDRDIDIDMDKDSHNRYRY